MPRRCFVIDPAWKRVERESYAAAWQQLAEEATGCKFVGLDLEWTSRPEPIIGEESSKNGDAEGVLEGTAAVRKRPNSVGPVAVVQLSTFSVTFVIKLCDVVRLTGGGDCGSRREDIVEPSTLGLVKTNLRSLLADECVSKVGVGILGDQAKLQRDYADFKLIPCVDLAVLARRLLPACEDVAGLRSLKALAARFAGTVLEKDILVTRSDWGGVLGPLSPLQVQYAAADAEASFDTCVGILRESHVVEGDEALRAACGSEEALRSVGAVLQAVSGVKPVTRKAHRKKYGEDGNALWRCKGRAKPYYHNIFVYDAEMNLVFTVDKSKAEWYVYKKGLAKVTEWRDAGSGGESSEPRKEIAAIQLSFTPDFAKYNDAYIRRNLDYFRQPKENQCVVCGNASDLVRFAVVPLVYRKYFPSVYMSHNSYDLLLLCTACFAVARSFYDNERRCIAEDFGVPLAHLTPREVEAYRAQQQQT
ncbi:exonuclease 3-5 domain containing 2, partial [Trypanosoma grayi]|uniref:exonuclease 3-5 domain containing 2 n=1 Tax=Trypanosoma grayi TaxID=71804 RepID=UPI0004F434AD